MHTFSLSVLEKAWEFLGWFEHAETIQYFAGSTQPLCLSHLTPAMTPLPPSTLLSPNFCFSFPGILLFSLQICSPLSGTGDAKWIGLSSRFCAKHPQNQPKSLGPSPATSPMTLVGALKSLLGFPSRAPVSGVSPLGQTPSGALFRPRWSKR